MALIFKNRQAIFLQVVYNIDIKKLLRHSDKSFQVHNTLLQLRHPQSSFEILNQDFVDIAQTK